MPRRDVKSTARLALGALLAILVMLASSASAGASTLPSSSPSVRPKALSAGRGVRVHHDGGLAPDVDSQNPAITFDDLPLETTVTDQYADDGVVFTSNVFTSEDGANPTSPVLSGEPRFEGEITAEFVTPGTTTPATVNGFSLDVGYIDNRDSVVVDYLDSNGFVVGSQYAQSLGINHLTITYRGIAGFTVRTVSDEPAGFAIDNLVVDPTVSTPVKTIGSLGDSYSSGEGRTDGKYDCGTNLAKATYFQDTTDPLFDPIWINGVDCDTRTFSTTRPADLVTRPWVEYENKCHRNGEAYPNLIAQAFGTSQFLFVACSGATTNNVGATEGLSQIKPTSQYPKSPVNVAGGHPQIVDLENFRKEKLGGHDPDVITIGVGGNDANFRPLIEHCALPWTSNCKDGTTWAQEALSNINGNVFDRLVDTFKTLRHRFPNSTLLVFGYPTVVEPGATCFPKTADLDSNETEFLGGTVLNALNSAVSDAAAQAGAFYIDISRVTEAHGVCASDPWVNGLIAGIYGVDPESFHPNVAAHQAIAQYFLDHYTDGSGNLLVANPEPSAPIRPEVGQSLHLATLNGTVVQDCGAGCLQPAAACVLSCQLEIQGGGYSPGSQLQIVLHSTPTVLGEVTADDDGEVDTTVTIPAGTEPGLHWLTMDGIGPEGEAEEGTLGVNVYATPPPPLRVHPAAEVVGPGPAPITTLGGQTPKGGTLAAIRKAVFASVRLTRRAKRLVLKLTCPREASSSCAITLTLRRVHSMRGRRHTQSVISKRVGLGPGKTSVVAWRNALIESHRRQLTLLVGTKTAAGTVQRSFPIPR